MINIKIMCVGKVKDKNLLNLIDEYKKRISKYAKLEIINVDDEKLSPSLSKLDMENVKIKESNKIINKLEKISKPYIIALDLTGNNLTSIQFSEKIENITLNGYSTIVFLIGGSLGMSNELLEMCNYKVCFSKLTFPHQLIRLFLLEQIFRAFKISNNETYHHLSLIHI